MAPREEFDVVVIGSGPGGYVAAVRSAQLGLRTACVEKDARLGGVCLNLGCIPSKALLDASEFFHLAKHRMGQYGVKTGRVGLDLAAMMARKDQVVQDLTDNVRKLLEANRVAIIHGKARLAGADRVHIQERSGGPKKNKHRTVDARAIILATGSEPISLPNLEFDGQRIVDSSDALRFESVPRRLGIVGAGYVGLELGSVWSRLGAKVTVIEMLPKIASNLDAQVGRKLQGILKRQGIDFHLQTRVTGASFSNQTLRVSLEGKQNQETITCDRLLVCVGRRPVTHDLGLEEAGVSIDAKTGRIPVDEAYRTNIPSVYAIGDLVDGPMLAHKASAEGIAAAECIAGKPGEVNYDAIPAVIYTWPEVAGVGLTEEQVRDRNIPCCVGVYPFSGAGRARCMGETDGFVKIIAHGNTDRVLGVHIIGPRAADMIAEPVLAIQFGASSEDIARTVHGHPTFAEALQEAAMAVRKCAIHS